MAEAVIIADSGPLIALARIGQLDLLSQLSSKVIIPPEIWNEVTIRGSTLPGAREVRSISWIKTRAPNPLLVNPLNILVDLGEAEAIALGQEISDCILLLDDSQARKVAKRLNLRIVGTIGLLLRAKRMGLIGEIRPCIERLQSSGIYIRQGLIDAVLVEADE